MRGSPYALLVLLVPMAVIFPLAYLWHRWSSRRWKLVAEGVCMSAEHGEDRFFRRPSVMVPLGRKIRRSKTTIRFRDGRTFILRPRAEIAVPSGSRIRIMHNSWEGHRIDPA